MFYPRENRNIETHEVLFWVNMYFPLKIAYDLSTVIATNRMGNSG